jgi:hypothetical protein
MEGTSWTVDDHLRGQPAASIDLYHRFVDLVAACGPYTCAVSKTTIVFKGVRRGFAGARPTARGLTAFLDLQRLVDDRRVISVAPYTKRLFVHQIRLTAPTDLDDEFASLVAEAYAIGQGAHMLDSTPQEG